MVLKGIIAISIPAKPLSTYCCPQVIKKKGTQLPVSAKTKIIFAVNLLGNPCDIEKLQSICKEKNIILIEDNCESLGAVYKKKFTGTFGELGSFSFFFSHHMQTMEGGMILTNNKNLYELCVSLRAHGWIRDLPNDNGIEKKNRQSFLRCV